MRGKPIKWLPFKESGPTGMGQTTNLTAPLSGLHQVVFRLYLGYATDVQTLN